MGEMIHLGLAIAFLVAGILLFQACVRRPESALAALGAGGLAGGAAGLALSAATGRLTGFYPLTPAFALATGIALGTIAFFVVRAFEEGSLLVAPPSFAVSVLPALALGFFLFDDANFLTRLGVVGAGVGATALVLLALGGEGGTPESTAGNYRRLSTVLILLMTAVALVGLQLFDVIVMNSRDAGLFLAIALGLPGVVLLGLGLARRTAPTGPEWGLGVATGLTIGAGFYFLLQALALFPSWRAFGLVATAQAPLAALVAMPLFGLRFRALGYVGLASSSAAAVLLYLN